MGNKKTKKFIKKQTFTFEGLVTSIQQVHRQLSAQASKAVNISLTLRNWMIGMYIDRFELHGSERAVYGNQLLVKLSKRLEPLNISNTNQRQLYRYLRFYRLYPSILGTLSPKLCKMLPTETISGGKVGTLSPKSLLDVEKLIQRLSYSHLELILDLDDPCKRKFYEIECMRGSWSVRELNRQIDSLYYERSGLSKNKKKLSRLVSSKAETEEPELTVKDPYIFEFLGLKPAEVMSESSLEDQLLDKLQEFLLELGHGFCFEARQKRILIGDTYSFVDLVFYHRILKCHVLVDLKLGGFSHENIGQLNTYVSWYRKNMMSNGDSLPVGILLCTRKDYALVEYALAGMGNSLFVSKYQLELPGKEEMQRFMEHQIREATSEYAPESKFQKNDK